MASDVLLQYVEVPFFAVDENFDAYALWVSHGDPSSKLAGLRYAKTYAKESEDAIQTLPDKNGYFMLSCVGHCFSAGFKMEDLTIAGQSLSDAWSSWYNDNKSVRVIEQCDKQWPPCNEQYAKG